MGFLDVLSDYYHIIFCVIFSTGIAAGRVHLKYLYTEHLMLPKTPCECATICVHYMNSQLGYLRLQSSLIFRLTKPMVRFSVISHEAFEE
jgi:hypothetical protein